MSYHFESSENIYQGTRRISKEETERAIENLTKQTLHSGIVKLSEADKKRISEHVVTEQQSKRRNAYYPGKKVYAEYPEAFGERMFYYFSTWKEELHSQNTLVNYHPQL